MAATQKKQLSQPRHEANDHDREPHHIRKLEKKIRLLSNALSRLGRGLELQELLIIIHRPGWTSIAEFEFTDSILDHIGAEIRALERLQDDLVEAANRVGQQK
jgi:hypothetical protein